MPLSLAKPINIMIEAKGDSILTKDAVLEALKFYQILSKDVHDIDGKTFE